VDFKTLGRSYLNQKEELGLVKKFVLLTPYAAPDHKYLHSVLSESDQMYQELQTAAPGHYLGHIIPQELPTAAPMDLDSGKKERLTKLLQKYDDVFSKSPSDIGRTGLVKLSINTGNNTPIKQRTRPVPFHRKAEVKDLVEDMVQNAFARPSNSPME
jgi:hypothetical protein